MQILSTAIPPMVSTVRTLKIKKEDIGDLLLRSNEDTVVPLKHARNNMGM